MICIRDDDIFYNAIWRHQIFLDYQIYVDIGIITSKPFPARWIRKHINMYEVCNHSHCHNYNVLINYKLKNQIKDLEKANQIIHRKIGVNPRYFIPPGGIFNKKLVEASEAVGLSLHPSYITMKKNPENYYTAQKLDLFGKKEGWYICHTFKHQPTHSRLKQNIKYLYDNKLTRFWD
jgi:hypothetical protein